MHLISWRNFHVWLIAYLLKLKLFPYEKFFHLTCFQLIQSVDFSLNLVMFWNLSICLLWQTFTKRNHLHIQTCFIISRVRLPGVDISDDETDDKVMRWEKCSRSWWWVSMRFHKFINAFPSCWSCKKSQNQQQSNSVQSMTWEFCHSHMFLS